MYSAINSFRPYDLPRSDHFLRPMGGFASRAGIGCQLVVNTSLWWYKPTLLESVLQLVRPHRLSILPSITTRASTVFQVLLRLEVAASCPARLRVGSNRVKSAKLALMKPCRYMLMMMQARRRQGLRRMRGMRILVAKLMERILTSSDISMSQRVRIRLDIPSGILKSSIRMNSNRVQ